MFHGNRWAAVFFAVLGTHAEAGFAFLKTVAPPLKTVSGALFGYSASRRLEAALRDVFGGAGGDAVPDATAEYVIRFIALLVEKKQFRHIDSILQKIEERLDAQKNTLAVTVETVSPLDAAFEEKLKRQIIERLGAAEVKMKTVLVPDLLGGYRLRIGGFYIDASLKGQMKKMEADLAGGLKYGGL